MNFEPLAPAYAKIKRAETHIENLNAAIGAFLETRPYRIVSQVNPDRTEEVWRFEPHCIPDDIEGTAADALHNLRTPLDKMLTALADHLALAAKKGQRHRGIQFPVGRNAKSFECALERQKEHLSADVIECLRDTEAHPGGAGALLFFLHDMDIDGKHHPLLTPINLGTAKKQIGSIKCTVGFPLIFGSRRGAHMIPAPDARPGRWNMVAPDDASRPILRKAPDGWHYLEFSGPHDDMEFLTTTPGAKFEIEFEPALNIAFSQIEGFEGEPVISVLQKMRDLVAGILLTFEKRFFS